MRKWIRSIGIAGGLVLSACAADYTWLANPLSANWLTDANWDLGAWDETATANKAIFGASAQTAVDVNGDVTVPSVAVSGADYAFGGTGTLTVNGSFNVAAGNTVTVNGPLAQAAPLANRLVKDGDGTLVVKGDSTLGYFAIHGGTVKFDGGTHLITNKTTGAGDSALGLSLARGTLIIEGGARVQTTTNSSYAANSGVDMYVTNGVFDVWSLNSQYLNAFGDNKGSFSTRKSMLTIKDEGEVIAKSFRISKAEATTYPDNQGEVNLGPGGRFVIRNFAMDEGASYKKYGTMNFDGGTLVMTNTPADKTAGGGINRFSTGDSQANQSWKNVHLYIKEGGLTIHSRGDNDSSFRKAFESGAEHDGGLRLMGSRTVYLYATNSYNGGTSMTGGVWCAVNSDRSLGAVPAEPTDNVFIQSDSVYFHFGATCNIHSNRTFRLTDGISAKIGTQSSCIGGIRGAIVGEKSVLQIVNNWSGITVLAPAEGITNRIGKLCVDGKLRIDSGVTLITSNCAAKVGTDCPLVIRGNSSSFTNTCGQLIIAGGLLKATQNCYITIGNYGQLIVTNGVLDLTATRELLNGINGANVGTGCGRTVVADGGELRCAAVRISQWAAMKDGLPVNSVNVQTGGVLRLNNFYIDPNANQRGLLNLDGGVVAARTSITNFLGTDNLKWRTNIIVRACAGGAIFDTGGYEIFIKNSVYSGAEQDGGLTKRGTGTLTMVNTNTYNGVTRLEGGTLTFSHADGYPGGDLEIAAAAVQGQTLAEPLLTANVLAFREGKGVRVTEADTLDDKTYGRMKTVATFTTPLAAVPSLTLVNADGTEWTNSKQWCLQLTDGGTTLKFGPIRGMQLIVR